jgi:hypothetical protein
MSLPLLPSYFSFNMHQGKSYPLTGLHHDLFYSFSNAMVLVGRNFPTSQLLEVTETVVAAVCGVV